MTQELTVMAEVKQGIVRLEGNLAGILPPQIPAKQFIKTAIMAIDRNPEMLEVDRLSLYRACQDAAADGLLLDGRQAAIVKFNKKVDGKWVPQAQYMPMVAGIIDKVRRSGMVSSLSAQVVKEGDEFDYYIDEYGPHLKHKPALINRGETYLAYATAVMKDKSVQIEVMTMDELESVRKSSKSGNKDGKPVGIWAQWPDEMRRKTVLRRLCKYLPSSTDISQVFDSDDRAMDFEPPAPPPATPEPGQPKVFDAIIGDADKSNVDDSII